jgi:tetratricopeptide (TPR) repeat protein
MTRLTTRLLLALAVLLAGFAWGSPAGAEDRLGPLFERLQATKDLAEAKRVEHQIWQEWVLAGSDTIDILMAKGIRELERRTFEAALDTFSAIIALEPELPEAWNKRATVHFLMGDFASSVRDIEKTLKFEPRHFGALSGLGMIYEALADEEAALGAFEAAHAINPHIGGMDTKLRELRRQVKGEKI